VLTSRGRRTAAQVLNHYCVEKALAQQLKAASRDERKALYRTLYDKLFSQVPDHPRLTRRSDARKSASASVKKFRYVAPFLDPSKTFVEFAPGDGHFARYVCAHARTVYAVDISDQQGSASAAPANFVHAVYDGYDVDLPSQMADIAFSDQLIEHIHPDDVAIHFTLVRRLLKPGGVYVFRTPHRHSGPHDVSRRFSREAEGFHLKEWTVSELLDLLQSCGYKSCSTIWDAVAVRVPLPKAYFTAAEWTLDRVPHALRRWITVPFIPGITIAAFS